MKTLLIFFRFFSFRRRCTARLFYYAPQRTICAEKPALAGGLGESIANIPHGWFILCTEGRNRCKGCPRLHALRKLASAAHRNKNENLVAIPESKADLRDRDRQVAAVYDFNSQTVGFVREQNPDRPNQQFHAVTADSLSLIHI